MHRLPGSHGFDIILFFSTGSCCVLKSNIPDIVFKKFLVINHAGIAVLVVNKISALINLRLLIGCGIESSVNKKLRVHKTVSVKQCFYRYFVGPHRCTSGLTTAPWKLHHMLSAN